MVLFLFFVFFASLHVRVAISMDVYSSCFILEFIFVFVVTNRIASKMYPEKKNKERTDSKVQKVFLLLPLNIPNFNKEQYRCIYCGYWQQNPQCRGVEKLFLFTKGEKNLL